MSGFGSHDSFRRHLVRAAPVFVGVTIVTLLLEQIGWLRGFETAALDTSLRLAKPIAPKFVEVVAINDDDYTDIFGQKSLLEAETLKKLIEAIAQANPVVIGVDIDTSSAGYRQVAADFANPRQGHAQIVWEREAIGENEPLQALKVLGGTDIKPAPLSGVAGLFEDWDGVVRRYQRHFECEVDEKGRVQLLDSFPWAIVKAFYHSSPDRNQLGADLRHSIDAEAQTGKKVTNDRLLNFSGGRYTFTPYAASFVLAAHEAEWWSKNNPFINKIVLLGGSYREGRDTYMTPLGRSTGVQLMAQAVESDLQNKGVHYVSEFLMLLFDLLAWIALVAIYYFCRLGIALWISLAGIPILSLTGSLVAFSSLAYWANFAPIVLGVLIHQLYDHAIEYRRLLRQAKQNITT